MKNNKINQKRKCQLFGTAGKPISSERSAWFSSRFSSPVTTDFGGSVEQGDGGEENREAICSGRWWHEDRKEHHHHADSHRNYAVQPKMRLGQGAVLRFLVHLLPPFQFWLFAGSRLILREMRRKAIQIPMAIKTNFKPTKDSDASPRKYTSVPQKIFHVITDTSEYNKNLRNEKWSIPAAVEVRAARLGCQ